MQYSRGLQTFLTEGHISYYTVVREQDILTKCDCFGMCYILPNQHVCRSYVIFSLLAKYLCGPGEMASRAGVGPEAVLGDPCNIATDRKH